MHKKNLISTIKFKEKHRSTYTGMASQKVYEFYVKNGELNFIKFKNISKYAGYRQQYWPFFLAIYIFCKTVYAGFGFFTTGIILETRHFNLNVVCKERDLILFST
jgi:hypothetical protein